MSNREVNFVRGKVADDFEHKETLMAMEKAMGHDFSVLFTFVQGENHIIAMETYSSLPTEGLLEGAEALRKVAADMVELFKERQN